MTRRASRLPRFSCPRRRSCTSGKYGIDPDRVCLYQVQVSEPACLLLHSACCAKADPHCRWLAPTVGTITAELPLCHSQGYDDRVEPARVIYIPHLSRI